MTPDETVIAQALEESIATKQRVLETQLGDIAAFAAHLTKTLGRPRGKVLLCGNGGSAGDAQHVAGEFVNRFLFDRRALPGIALTTDTSVMTAIGNDSSYDEIFSRQVEALGNEGDALIAISTSGNSPNVLRAVEAARGRDMVTLGLTGGTGGALATACDLCLTVPSPETPRIQEAHITILHIVCQLVEQALCGDEAS